MKKELNKDYPIRCKECNHLMYCWSYVEQAKKEVFDDLENKFTKRVIEFTVMWKELKKKHLGK